MTGIKYLEFRQSEYIENRIALLKVLKQTNNYSAYDEYIELRKLNINCLVFKSNCVKCIKDILIDDCDNLVNQMPPKYITTSTSLKTLTISLF